MNLFSVLVLIFSLSISAYDPEHTKLKNTKPTELDGIDLKYNMGAQIPLSLTFLGEDGNPVSLSSYFNQGKPVVLSMVYYKCPTLCNFHLNGINKVFKELEWNLGEKYVFLAVSIDPSETPDLARQKRDAYIEEYKSGGKFRLEGGMHFLTGPEASSKTLASALGFPYKYNPGNKHGFTRRWPMS